MFLNSIFIYVYYIMSYTDANNVTYTYTVPASGTTGTAAVNKYPPFIPGFVNILQTFVVNGVTYTVTKINNYALFDNYITGLVIPSTVKNIGIWATGNVRTLKEVYFRGTTIPSYGFQSLNISSPSTGYFITGTNVTSVSSLFQSIIYLSPSEMNLAILAKNVPSAPTIASVNSLTRVNPTISIGFTDPENPSITNYSWSTNGTNYTVLSPAQATSPLTIPVTGLTSGSPYIFRIKAINAAGTSAPSAGVSATFTMPPPPPAAPTISTINGASQDGKISISFTQSPSDSTITNYSWTTDGTNYTDLNPAQKTSPLNIPVNGLNSGSEYTFRIKAINPSGSSDASTGFSNAVTVTIPLSVPVITNVSHVNGSINIYYRQSLAQETGVTSIKYSTNNGETYTSTNVTTSPLKISGLKPKTHHQIILKANNGSDSEPSNTYGLTYYIKVGNNDN
jgi:hypothetical protein